MPSGRAAAHLGSDERVILAGGEIGPANVTRPEIDAVPRGAAGATDGCDDGAALSPGPDEGAEHETESRATLATKATGFRRVTRSILSRSHTGRQVESRYSNRARDPDEEPGSDA